MQIEYKETFLKGYCDRKPSQESVAKKALRKGFDITNFEMWVNVKTNYWNFKADTYPSKETTKKLEAEILSKLDILFQRKNYSKEEQTEIKRLIQLWK